MYQTRACMEAHLLSKLIPVSRQDFALKLEILRRMFAAHALTSTGYIASSET